MEAGQKFLIVLLTLAIVIASVLTVYTATNSVPKFITGYATNTGEVNLSVEENVEINFTTKSINFGSGRVDTGQTFATLDTNAGTVTNGNWTANSVGLILENIGNINASINIKTGKTNVTFIGGTSPLYQFMINDVEANSCTQATGFVLNTYTEVNTTSIGTEVCNPLNFDSSMDTINLDVKLNIPYDSLKGALSDTITATATAA
jgi:hypothetical protein